MITNTSKLVKSFSRKFSTKPVPITVAYGDGIGPEIMECTLNILNAGGAKIAPEVIEVGEKVYLRGNSTGIEASSWDSLRRTGIILKAPITTPLGGGYKSLNVTIRTTLGLYANVRPCQSYQPYIPCKHKPFNMVIVRENEEDLYSGIEHRQTDEVYQCLKLISRPGCEKIIRYAFDYARKNGRNKVTGIHKSNIMKKSDGIFVEVFNEIGAKEYPEIKRDTMIVDIATALVADKPEIFDVIVLPNLYGDILSDVAAQVSGSVGLGSSVNIGDRIAMFEAIHGSAPDITGKDIANPSGLLLAGVDMLSHIGQHESAVNIFNAWMKTIEDGMHTGDIYRDGVSKKKVGTREFAKIVLSNLGQKPKERAREVPKSDVQASSTALKSTKRTGVEQTKITSGIDVFIDYKNGRDSEVIAKKLQEAIKSANGPLELKVITNRGVKVWPNGFPETFCTDQWRCRFLPKEKGTPTDYLKVIDLLKSIHTAGFDVIKTENLCYFKNPDGSLETGFSLAQGE